MSNWLRNQEFVLKMMEKYSKYFPEDETLHMLSMIEVGEEEIALESLANSCIINKIKITQNELSEMYDLALENKFHQDTVIPNLWEKLLVYSNESKK
jgi:hypothetical protein